MRPNTANASNSHKKPSLRRKPCPLKKPSDRLDLVCAYAAKCRRIDGDFESGIQTFGNVSLFALRLGLKKLLSPPNADCQRILHLIQRRGYCTLN